MLMCRVAGTASQKRHLALEIFKAPADRCGMILKSFLLQSELICDRHDFIIAKWIDVIHLVRHISYRLERLNRSTTYQLVASVMNRSVKILKQSEHLDQKCPMRNNQYSIGCAQDSIILTCFLKWHFQYFKCKINCPNSKRPG